MTAVARERVFEGRHLEEALAAAAAATGVPEEDLHYEILEQGRRGLFGLGAKSVRIRIEEPGAPEEPQTEPALRTEAPGEGPRSPQEVQRPGRNSSDRAAVGATLQRMIDLMGLDLRVRAEAVEGGLDLVLTGPDRSLLAQRDSELRSALQFLINRMARRSWPETGRIQLTMDGQTPRRDEDIVGQIREVAAQVARTGKPQLLRPMNAYERRLVHLTVREFEGLGSRSDGSGHLKRVSIFKQPGS